MRRKTVTKTAAIILSIVFLIALTPLINAVEIESVTVSKPTQEPAVQNHAPIAENLSYTTYRGVPVCGMFMAIDPEGDILSFRLLSQPKKGTVQVSDGSFVYTPKDGKKGKDSFSYVAVDSVGNESKSATISIQIEKQSTKISYSDMNGNPSHYSALRLAEEGIFIGEQVGDKYYFNPEDTLTRGEFLAMCVSMAGLEPIYDIKKTGFADDEDMPLWVKPYVSTALMSGVISGYTTPAGSIVFNATAPITQAEAAVMLNNVLGVTNVKRSNFEDSDLVPTWAYQAVSNLSACRIIPDISLICQQSLTRAQAAEMLTQAIDLENSRASNSSLLSWAW